MIHHTHPTLLEHFRVDLIGAGEVETAIRAAFPEAFK